MIARALRHGVRSIIFTDLGTWQRRSVQRLAIEKLAGKLVPRFANAHGSGGGVRGFLLDIGYRRGIRAVLAAARLPLGDQNQSDLPAGIVLACPTLVAGGAERQIVNTAVGLRDAGLGPITVLVARLHNPPGHAFFLDHLLSAGVDVREARSAETGLQRWLNIRRIAETPGGEYTLSLLQRLPEAIRQDVLEFGVELVALRPAVVHCWLDYGNVRAGLAAVCAGVPRIVLSGRNVGPGHFPYIFEPYMRSVYRALLDCPGVVLTNNSHGGAADYAAWLGIAAERIPVIYNGLDLMPLRRPPPEELGRFRHEHGVAADALLVGGMFRLSAEKRPLLWLEVAAQIVSERPDTIFLVFGEGPLHSTMQQFIDQHALGASVRILPPTRQSALALSAFDVLLLTSQWEGTPNVAIEAQAVGTPVVLLGGGGAREAVDAPRTGLYVEASAAPAVAKEMIGLLADGQARASMAAASPAFVRTRFGHATMIEATRRIYGAAATSPRERKRIRKSSAEAESTVLPNET